MSEPRTIWAKDCECRARATTNSVRMATRFNEETQSYMASMAFHPMPSCDECGKPWKLEPKPARSETKGGTDA